MRQYLVPTGGILPFAGAVATEGYLLCDGSSYDITKYEDLYKVILFTYGGSVATFKVPDLRGRVPVGAGTGTGGGIAGGPNAAPTGGVGLTPRSIGAYDGDERLHAHLHPITDVNHNHTIIDPGHDHRSYTTINGDWVGISTGYGEGGWAVADSPGYNNNTSHIGAASNTTGITNQQSLSGITTTTNNSQGGLRGNVQPSVVLNYLIKY